MGVDQDKQEPGDNAAPYRNMCELGRKEGGGGGGRRGKENMTLIQNSFTTEKNTSIEK